MKKLVIGLLGAMMVMGIVACGNTAHQKEDKEGQAQGRGVVRHALLVEGVGTARRDA